MGRGQEATREACAQAAKENVDVLMLQEPYNVRGVVRGEMGRWFYCEEDGEVWSAVVVLKEEIVAMLEREKSDRYVACVLLEWNGVLRRVVSVYCRFSLDIGGMLNRVERILLLAGDREVIIGADVNARSHLWGEEETDVRGEEVKDIVVRHELVVLNVEGQLKTFEDAMGRGRNLDITMVTKDLGRCTWRWQVVEVTLSDHRMIEVEMVAGVALEEWSMR